jgi:asparagine synthase (glutamine-hydrolysing)
VPGLAAVIGPASREELQAYVTAMVAAMQHEPDWLTGIVSAPELGVCAGWVNRGGSFAAAQNAARGSGGSALLMCGECVDDAGADANLLRRYEAEGANFVRDLNGLFSGLLIDRPSGHVLLFNDRFGSERVYHHQRGGLTFLASEAKALLAVLPELRAFDERGVADFLALGSTQETRTLFRGVAQLPGASLWTFRGRGARVDRGRYFDVRDWEEQTSLDERNFCTALAEAMKRVLPRHLSNSASIGLSVTGGLDTRMILACLPEERRPAIAYTYAGLTGETLDCRIGAKAAALRGIRHRTLRIAQDFCQNYDRYLDRTVYLTDGCAGAMAAHEVYLTALARQLAPIRLTGNFGSEVLRGVSMLKPLGLDGGLFDGAFAPTILHAESEGRGINHHPVTRAAFREIPWHLFGTVAAARAHLTLRTPYLDNDLVQLAYRAPASMRRSPEPSLHLIATNHASLAALPTDRGLRAHATRAATLARRVAAEVTFKLDYLHQDGLPHWLSRVDRAVDSLGTLGLLGWHKYLPYRGWFRRELAPYVRDVAADARGRGLPFWNPRFVDAMVLEHIEGRRNRLREIHAFLTLQAVQRLFFHDRSMPPAKQQQQHQVTVS